MRLNQVTLKLLKHGSESARVPKHDVTKNVNRYDALPDIIPDNREQLKAWYALHSAQFKDL